MFSRFITSGVNNKIDTLIIERLWNLIDSMDIKEKDYLQVFEIEKLNDKLIIEHRQEIPEYKKIHVINLIDQEQENENLCFKHLTTDVLFPDYKVKIFVMDSLDYSTMMLAEEY